MPANHKVSVAWQIVFTFLPIVNFWAFYRIRKLTSYFLYIMAPAATTAIILAYYLIANTGSVTPQFDYIPLDQLPQIIQARLTAIIISNVVGWGLQGLSIYLVIIWSRKHNRSFDAPLPT